LFVLTFGLSHADAGQNQTPQNLTIAQADQASEDLPSGIELKPGAAKTAADQSADTKTRQIVTEGKDAGDADDADADAEAADTDDNDADDKADAAKKADDDGDDTNKAAADTDDEDENDEADTAKGADEPDDGGDDPKEAAAEEADEGENLALAVQSELKRVGCYSSSLDGLWGHRSQQALAAFGHFAHAKIGDLSPTADVLAIIKGKDGVVCIAEVEEPGPAPKRHRKQGYGDGGYDGGGYGGGGYDGGGYDGGGYVGGGGY
jgi:hypothetical protein